MAVSVSEIIALVRGLYRKRIEKQRCCFGENAHVSASSGTTIKRNRMKRTRNLMKTSGLCAALAVGLAANCMAAASSATPVTWVQSVNLTITGHTPSDLSPNGSKLNNKGLLEDLSGATVTNFVGGTSTSSVTNQVVDVTSGSPDINVTNDGALGLSTNNFVLIGTNGIFGTNGTAVFANFPSSLTVTGVTFQTQSGTNVATNMTLTLSLNTNATVPTYTFANSTTVTTTNATN